MALFSTPLMTKQGVVLTVALPSYFASRGKNNER